jgi:hypothetical protein
VKPFLRARSFECQTEGGPPRPQSGGHSNLVTIVGDWDEASEGIEEHARGHGWWSAPTAPDLCQFFLLTAVSGAPDTPPHSGGAA